MNITLSRGIKFITQLVSRPPPSSSLKQAFNAGWDTCTAGRRFGVRGATSLIESEQHDESVVVSKERLDELMQNEMAYMASIPVRPVSMREVLDCHEPHTSAKFIQAHVPARFAIRMRLIETLCGWQDVPELVQSHGMLDKWYRMLRLVPCGAELREFTSCTKNIRVEGRRIVGLIAKGIPILQRNTGDKYSDEFLNRWMDGYFLSRIASNMLLDQYIAIASKEDGGMGKATGVVDLRCNAVEVCKQAAVYAQLLCTQNLGKEPVYEISHYKDGVIEPLLDSPCHLSFIPNYLRYIMIELLKNSFKATIVNAKDAQDVRRRPIQVLLCHDDQRVTIRVSDRAGGIPFDVGEQIWSYLYGAAANSASGAEVVATPLAGYGVGLPLSRLHARFLGGKLDIISFPGYGTDAVVVLPKVDTEQVLELPCAADYQSHEAGDDK